MIKELERIDNLKFNTEFVIWNHNFEAVNFAFNFNYIFFVIWENKVGMIENLDELAF